MMDNKNYILAIVLSMAVLIGWQFFVVSPRMEAQQARQAAIEAQNTGPTAPQVAAPGTAGSELPEPAGDPPGPDSPSQRPTVEAGPVAVPAATREAALAAGPRLAIDTPRLAGSVNLRGGRIDDLSLKDYHETVDDTSPNIVLLSPEGVPNAYYAEFGWVPAAGTAQPVPDASTEWQASTEQLTANQPVELTWDNGQGLTFRRTISVDENYMFAVNQAVVNTTGAPVSLYPYALVSRHGTPQTSGFFILHEGMIGVLGEEGLEEVDYSSIAEDGQRPYQTQGGWLGITDKYWATTLIPDQGAQVQARFVSNQASALPTYQADYLMPMVTVAAGATSEVTGRLFAGAKEVGIIEAYESAVGIDRFELLIDWGWFYFITKPLFYAIDFFFNMFGNFGVSILIVTIIIKTLFLPLAYKSYVSMSRMKLVQPEMLKIRERFPDDRMKQQQAMMELYKKEKINPVSGCLPILVQIPVFFALYKVLFVTIEMRHAPFFGWIQDLSAPDPTSVFNLFGLIPWDPPSFLLLGIWPIIMGITMWVQMRLNPTPPDPIQATIFNWMPVVFTFMLASFPAGLVIYWAWNNSLSIAQQMFIMRRQGVPIDLWGNIRGTFNRREAKKSEG